MANNFNPKEGIDIQLRQDEIDPAADEMRQRLNEVITGHGLSGESALAVLAKLSAAYIHLQQRFFNDPGAKDAVEDLFTQTLQHYLALFDMTDMQREMNRK